MKIFIKSVLKSHNMILDKLVTLTYGIIYGKEYRESFLEQEAINKKIALAIRFSKK